MGKHSLNSSVITFISLSNAINISLLKKVKVDNIIVVCVLNNVVLGFRENCFSSKDKMLPYLRAENVSGL